MAYTEMCRWTGYGFWPLCPEWDMQFYATVLNRVRTCPKQGMGAQLSSLNMAYTVYSNPKTEMYVYVKQFKSMYFNLSFVLNRDLKWRVLS